MPIDRAPFNALVDDPGNGTGTIWNKAAIKTAILDPIDAALVGGGGAGGFRGVRLRTAADSELAPFCVVLEAAADLGMSDGSRVGPITAPILANRYASGAGGMAPGQVFAASQWYDVHVIAPAAGAPALMLASAPYVATAAAGPTVNAVGPARDNGVRERIGQSFSPAWTAPVPAADLYLRRVGTPDGYVWITIETDASGFPSGTPIATSSKFYAGWLPDGTGGDCSVRFIFPTPATLTGGVRYHLVLYGSYNMNTPNYVGVLGYTGASLPADQCSAFNGSAWAPGIPGTAIQDLGFTVIGGPFNPGVPMPAGYTRRCLVGHVWADASAVFRMFVQQERRVHSIGAVALTTTAPTPQFVNLAAIVPMGAILAHVRLLSNVTGDAIGMAGVPGGQGGVQQTPFISATMGAPNGTMTVDDLPTTLQSGYVWRIVGSGNASAYVYGYTW